jgi:hypothetical protein
MNLAAVFAALIQLGVCAPVQFAAPDGSKLTVLVCPIQAPAEPAGDVPVVPPPVKGKQV